MLGLLFLLSECMASGRCVLKREVMENAKHALSLYT
jgi:hypothetical protein